MNSPIDDASPPRPLPWNDTTVAADGRQVRENFRHWFGESQAVGAGGVPRVFFHGTSADVVEFKPGPVWLHADPAQAFANNSPSANLMPVYLRIERPLYRTGYFGMEDFSRPERFKFFDKVAGRWVTPDGVIGDNGVAVVFAGEQIKSAIGNSGLYGPGCSLCDSVAEYHAAQQALADVERPRMRT